MHPQCVSLKRLLIALACICSTFLGQAQEIDTLRYFALNNESLFWRLISKYYPLSHDQIDQYSDALAFNWLPENENIRWTDELIKKYKYQLDLGYVFRNRSFEWSEERILKYYPEPWFDWGDVAFRKKVFLSSPTYLKYKYEIDKEMVVEEVDKGVLICSEWCNEYGQKILLKDFLYPDVLDNDYVKYNSQIENYFDTTVSKVPVNLIIQNIEYFSSDIFDSVEVNWSWSSFSDLHSNENVRFWEKPYKAIYYFLMSPYIDNSFLDEINKNQNDVNRYYFFSREDQFGLVPSVYRGYNSTCDQCYLRGLPTNIFDYSAIANCNIELHGNYEAPKRFLDYLEYAYDKSVIIVSPKLKAILDECILPNHQYYAFNLIGDCGFYGKDTLKYYFLHFNSNNPIIYNSFRQYSKSDLFKQPLSSIDSLYFDISDSISFMDYRRSELNSKNYTDIKCISIDRFFDLVYLPYHGVYFSKRLRDAIINAKLYTPFFKKDIDCHIYIANSDELESAELDEKINYTSGFGLSYDLHQHKFLREYRKGVDSIKKLYQSSGQVTELYANQSDGLSNAEKELRNIEIEFDVIFPETYRDILKGRTQDQLNDLIAGDWRFYPKEELFPVLDFWYPFAPITAKGIFIGAGRQSDEFIGLLLKEGSSYLLDGQVYVFNRYDNYTIEKAKLK